MSNASALTRTASGTVLNTRKNLRDKLNELSPYETWNFFADFNEQAIVEADSPYIFNAGSDAQAIDPAINDQKGGVLRLTAGDGDGTAAEDGSQVVVHIPLKANYGGLMGHYHVQTNKTDPGPAFDWDRLVNGAREFMKPGGWASDK